MRNSILIFPLAIFSAVYIFFFVGWPSNLNDQGFVIRCFQDKYHTYRIDESFINSVNDKGQTKHPGFGYTAVNDIADIFLRLACRNGLPAEIPDQEKMLEQIIDDVENQRVPPTYTDRAPNYDVFYYPGTLDFVPDAVGWTKIIFLVFLNHMIYLWFKK